MKITSTVTANKSKACFLLTEYISSFVNSSFWPTKNDKWYWEILPLFEGHPRVKCWSYSRAFVSLARREGSRGRGGGGLWDTMIIKFFPTRLLTEFWIPKWYQKLPRDVELSVWQIPTIKEENRLKLSCDVIIRIS